MPQTVNIRPAIPQNATRALSGIRAMIDKGEVDGDGRLPTERELAQRLGVARRAVRQALEALETEGLIWRRQGKGTFIGTPPDPAGALVARIAPEMDPLTVMEARLALEPALAGLCARRATAEDVERLRALAGRTALHDSGDTAELWDGALHRLIARVAGNPFLMTAFAMLDEVRMGEEWQKKRHRARSPELVARYDGHHQAIIDAVAARDAAGAEAAMKLHLSEVARNLRKTLDPGP